MNRFVYEEDRKYKKHYRISRRKADQAFLKEARHRIAVAIVAKELSQKQE